jgi:hypothetical protein
VKQILHLALVLFFLHLYISQCDETSSFLSLKDVSSTVLNISKRAPKNLEVNQARDTDIDVLNTSTDHRNFRGASTFRRTRFETIKLTFD